MESGRVVPSRRKFGVLIMLMGLLSGLFAVLAPPASAEALNPGTLGGFENEGDQDDATLNTGNIDWETVKTDPRITEWALIHDDNDVDTADATFLDSAKEQDPSTWACAANESPPKDDIFRLYLASQITVQGQFLHIGYVREKAEGDTDINIEFNQVSGQFSCPGDTGGRVRTRDDLMISFTFGGGADPSVINVFRWDPTAASDGAGDPDPTVTGSDFVPGDGHWDLVALAPNVAAGADNSTYGDEKGEALILDQFFNDAPLEPRAFGELTLDLGGIFGGSLLGCPGYGFVTGHSRASHSFASDLKDIFPETQFDLSDCARIKIKKVDDSVPPVAQQGAEYGLYDSLAKAQAVANQTDAAAKAAAVSWCTTGADGTCFLEKADPDKDYWITEIKPPTGLLPSTEIRAITAAQLEPFGTLDLTGAPFVNAVPVGNVTITKRLFDDANNNGVLDPGEQVTPDQASDLDGISFALQQGGQASTTHPAGLPAACTISGGTGQCTISSVKLGTYQIVETLAPNGPSGIGLGTSPSVTLTTAGATVQATYDNPLTPLNIDLDKSGPSTAVIGDVITYTFDVTTTGPPLTITSLVEVVEPPDFDDRCDAGSPLTGPTKSADPGDDDDALLEVGEVWRWTCMHTVTAGDATDNDGALLQNKAQVTGKDSLGRTVSDDDTHTVTINLPGVGVEKTTSTPSVSAGGGVAFTIILTNDSEETPGSVSFTDNLPDGVLWSFDGTPPEACVLNTANDLVCTALEVPADDTVTIDLVGTSDTADCPSISNPPFTITVANEPAELAGDNTTQSVPIAVNCPPDVTVVKTTSTPSVSPGGAVSFDIKITNAGEGVAEGVAFSDPLPDSVTWSLSGDVPEGCSLTVANDLSCSFATLGAKQFEVVHLVGTADAGDCPSITNPVSKVFAQNEPTSLTDNNSTVAVTIRVTCPPPPPPPPPPPSPIDIEIVKDGPTLAHRGDEITYDFTVTNTGDVALVTVVLTDPICDAGTLVLVDDGNGDTTLAVDEVWTYECTRVITETDPDPLPNTATVRGTDVQGRTTDDADDHEVDLIEPAILIVKTVDDETPAVGQTVTYTYVVTNTGDTTLFNVEVVDDRLGAIGTIDELAAGASATLTKTMVVAANSPTVNIATATGADVLDKVVTDEDDATITVVLGEVVTPPVVQPRTLPRTGADSDRLLVVSGLLFLLGGLLVVSGEGSLVVARRRRS